MRRVLIVVVLVVAAAILGLWRSQGGVREGLRRTVGAAETNSQGVTGDEIRKTFQLKPGARVFIQGINGRVEIKTSDTQTAEVLVRRTGDSPASLRRREITIEETGDGLVVRSKQNRVGIWDRLFGHNPREEVIINAPRQIALSFKGVNGSISATDIEGTVEVKGVNGKVELGQTSGSADISGVNGRISVGLKSLEGSGARFSGVNGGIELRLANGLNADLTAKGMNGNVRSEIPEVTVDKEEYSRSYSARIGTGGAPITISGVNGNVRLTRPEGVTVPVTAANEKKPASSEKIEKVEKTEKAETEARLGRSKGQ